MSGETAYVREPGYPQRYRDIRFASGSGARTHRREVRALRWLLARASPPPGPWLDVPCGAGRLTDLLPGPTWQVDRDPGMVAACAQGAIRLCASALALPCADGVFAGVLCMRLMQHLPSADERIACLRELRRVCRGPVLVSYFDALSLQHMRRVLRNCIGRRRSRRVCLRAKQFEGELQAAGLHVEARRPIGRWVSEQSIVLARPGNS